MQRKIKMSGNAIKRSQKGSEQAKCLRQEGVAFAENVLMVIFHTI